METTLDVLDLLRKSSTSNAFLTVERVWIVNGRGWRFVIVLLEFTVERLKMDVVIYSHER